MPKEKKTVVSHARMTKRQYWNLAAHAEACGCTPAAVVRDNIPSETMLEVMTGFQPFGRPVDKLAKGYFIKLLIRDIRRTMSDHPEYGIGEQVAAITQTCPWDEDAIGRLYLRWCRAIKGEEGHVFVEYAYSWEKGTRSLRYLRRPEDTAEYIALLKGAIHGVCKKMGGN